MLQEVGDIHESEGDMEAAVDALQQAAEYLAVRRHAIFYILQRPCTILLVYGGPFLPFASTHFVVWRFQYIAGVNSIITSISAGIFSSVGEYVQVQVGK